MVDGKGPLPDSRWEVASWIGIGVVVVLAFGFVSGLDAHAEFILTAPSDYVFSSAADSGEGEVVFDGDQVSLMNEVSSRSLGSDAVAAERLYCGSIRNGRVRNFRFADVIEGSDLTSVRGSCISDVGPVDIWVHSQPGGSGQLSAEDKDLESNPEYTCIQYAEVAVSPVSGEVNGLNCWEVVDGGDVFEQVSVSVQG